MYSLLFIYSFIIFFYSSSWLSFYYFIHIHFYHKVIPKKHIFYNRIILNMAIIRVRLASGYTYKYLSLIFNFEESRMRSEGRRKELPADLRDWPLLYTLTGFSTKFISFLHRRCDILVCNTSSSWPGASSSSASSSNLASATFASIRANRMAVGIRELSKLSGLPQLRGYRLCSVKLLYTASLWMNLYIVELNTMGETNGYRRAFINPLVQL